MSSPATALICYRYAFKVSPTLKNICSFLHETEGTTVEVIVDSTYSDEGFELPGVEIIDTGAQPCYKYFLKPLLRMDKKRHFQHVVRSRISRYSRVFAVDFLALEILNQAGYDLSKVIFLSLEGTDYMQHYGKAHTAELLARCAMRIVQSRERADDINVYLSSSLAFEYLPVSCRFQPLNRTHGRDDRLQLIYSGYFAEWACLSELLTAYRRSGTFEIAPLLLQGHAIGTEGYLLRVKKEAADTPATAVDTSYYSDAAHAELLAKYHVGLAFYKNIHETANFDNLILSSGKVATYLWNGLAVLTDIPSEYSNRPPFVFVDLSDASSLRKAVVRIDAERESFRDAAYQMANTVYNFDTYIAGICEKMPSFHPQGLLP